MSLNVVIVPVLNDNYAYIITSGDICAVIDPGEPDPVILELNELGLTPNYIFNTHHHHDHVAGNAKIKAKYNCKIIGPEAEEERIIGMDKPVNESTTFQFGDERVEIIETPGHTLGHICFYFPDSHILFAGDTLFSMGCGRLFEGTALDMFESLQKIKILPPHTQIYCGHEYTMSNGKFCEAVRPDLDDIKTRIAYVKKLLDNDQPSIPVTLEEELKTNLFLMAKNAQEFADLRAQKDRF